MYEHVTMHLPLSFLNYWTLTYFKEQKKVFEECQKNIIIWALIKTHELSFIQNIILLMIFEYLYETFYSLIF